MLAAVLSLVASAASVAADTPDKAPPDAKSEEPTLLEKLLVTPRKDLYSDADRKRAAIERSLPGSDLPQQETGWDAFLDTLLDADVNHANHEQRTMIEKLDDPDTNRLPR